MGSQQMMRQIFLSALNDKTNYNDGLPLYIQRLMHYHKTSTKSVNLIYNEMLYNYEWLKDILRFTNIFKICEVLTDFNSIIFRMPISVDMEIFEKLKIKWIKEKIKISKPLMLSFWWEDTNECVSVYLGDNMGTLAVPYSIQRNRGSTTDRSAWAGS